MWSQSFIFAYMGNKAWKIQLDVPWAYVELSKLPRLAVMGGFKAMRTYITLQKHIDSHSVLEIFEFEINTCVCVCWEKAEIPETGEKPLTLFSLQIGHGTTHDNQDRFSQPCAWVTHRTSATQSAPKPTQISVSPKQTPNKPSLSTYPRGSWDTQWKAVEGIKSNRTLKQTLQKIQKGRTFKPEL